MISDATGRYRPIVSQDNREKGNNRLIGSYRERELYRLYCDRALEGLAGGCIKVSIYCLGVNKLPEGMNAEKV